MKQIEAAANAARIELSLVGVQSARDIPVAFAHEIVTKKIQGLIVFPDGMFLAEARTIISLAAQSRIPAMYGITDLAKAGGLMAYGVDFDAMFRRGASFVDRIFNGQRPADLPVEQPSKFDLVINFKTAQALDLTIPALLLARADLVIN